MSLPECFSKPLSECKVSFVDEASRLLREELSDSEIALLRAEVEEEFRPGESYKTDDRYLRGREQRLHGFRVAGFGKTKKGFVWVESGWYDHAYSGFLGG